jgi:hypothetical protein
MNRISFFKLASWRTFLSQRGTWQCKGKTRFRQYRNIIYDFTIAAKIIHSFDMAGILQLDVGEVLKTAS